MDTKSIECFGTDPRARGLRIELSAQHSLVLPHEHFVYSELKADAEHDTLKLLFVTHEVVITGYMLRRVEHGMHTRELAWVSARSDRYRPHANEKAFISRVDVRILERNNGTAVQDSSDTDATERIPSKR